MQCRRDSMRTKIKCLTSKGIIPSFIYCIHMSVGHRLSLMSIWKYSRGGDRAIKGANGAKRNKVNFILILLNFSQGAQWWSQIWHQSNTIPVNQQKWIFGESLRFSRVHILTEVEGAEFRVIWHDFALGIQWCTSFF